MRCKCKIIREIYSNGNYRILACIPTEKNSLIKLNSYHNFIIVGDLQLLQIGQEYELDVIETYNKHNEIQYKVVGIPSFEKYNIEDINNLTPLDEYDLLTTIMSKQQAQYVNQAYNNFVKLIVSGREKEIDINKIYNVGKVRINIYIDKINHIFKYYQLIKKNQHYNFTYNEIFSICKKYKDMFYVQKMIDENPYYILVDICKRNFELADNLIVRYNSNLKISEQRCEYLIRYLLYQNELDGNTCILGNQLARYVAAYDMDLFPLIKNTINDSSNIYIDNETSYLFLYSTFLCEDYIAERIVYNINYPIVWDIDYNLYSNLEINLTESQLKVLKYICLYNIVLLIGYAGSGKTTATKALVKMLKANNKSFTLVAPTGRAAKVLSQTTGEPAFTIHKRILEHNEIDSDVLIIDECSMVSVQLMNDLLHCTATYTKILMICDNEQLISIECGNVIEDLIKTNIIPIVKLTDIFRYGTSGLLTVATDARNGNLYIDDYGKLKNLSQDDISDYKFININKSDILNKIEYIYNKLLEKYSVNDIIILSPFNVGQYGTYVFNYYIQNLLKSKLNTSRFVEKRNQKYPEGKMRFYIGDKVINTKNNYQAATFEFVDYESTIQLQDQELKKIQQIYGIDSKEYENKYNELEELKNNPPSKAFVMNGDIGTIIDIDDSKNIYVQFDEQIIVYNKTNLDNLSLAYAISVHKFQGSQTKAVILVADSSHLKILSKNLIYVALTRAQDLLIEIGDPDTIQKALLKSETSCRVTFLKQLIERRINIDK